MSPMDQWKIVVVFAPIISMIVLGSWVAIRSGVVELASWQGMRRMAQNMSQAVIWTGVCLLALAVVQQIVGFRLALVTW